MYSADYHMHTSLCDGKDTPENMVLHAINLGMKHLGISGHFDPGNGVSMDKERYISEISALKEKYSGKIDLLMGGEFDCLYPNPEQGSQLDYVIGSTHSALYNGNIIPVDESEEKLKEKCEEYFSGDYYKLSECYFETEAKIIENVHPDFIGHFDLVTRYNDDLHFIDEDDPRYIKPALETMEFLCSAGIPFEINCGAVNRNRKKDFYPAKRLLKALKDMGGRIVISSDAHSADKITGAFDKAVERALECGFTHTNILVSDDKKGVKWVEIPLDSFGKG